jgi:hypothetical protein
MKAGFEAGFFLMRSNCCRNPPIKRRSSRHKHPARRLANIVLACAKRRFAGERLKRVFCFNVALLAFSGLILIEIAIFESSFLDGFVN